MAADLQWFLSANGSSTGGARGMTAITDAVMNNVWPSITDTERLAGGSRVRKIFVANESGVDPWVRPVLWIGGAPAGCTADLGLGFDTADDANADQLNLTAWAAAAKVAAISDGADTRTLTIYGEAGGLAVQESLVLNGNSEVASTTSFVKVNAVRVDAVSASRVVTLKQGSGGTTRGTIGISRIMSSAWQVPLSKAGGIRLPDLIAGAAYGLWERVTWPAGVSGTDLTDLLVLGEAA